MEILNKYIKNTFKGDRLNLLNLSDGQLHTEDNCTFPIHRVTLADKSRYFFAVFCGIEKNKKEALIPGIKGIVLSDILTYIYTGEIHVITENICDLFIAADYLLLEDLLSQMKTLIAKNLSVENSLAIFTAALKINSEDILQKSLRFIEINFEAIIHSRNKGFCELPLETMKKLLTDRNIRIRNENVVWLAIVEWVSAYMPNRLSFVPDLLLCLTIAELNESLAEHILQHDFVARNTSCQRIWDIKSTNPGLSNLGIFQHYIQNGLNPNQSVYDYRSPLNLQFIAYYNTINDVDSTEIYVTYDEKLDLWHKVLEVSRNLQHFLAVNDCIYMFEKSTINCFSITQKQWIQFRNFRVPRYDFIAVKLNRLIYTLGGFSIEGDDVFDVEVYDPNDDIWYDTTPMPRVFDFVAAILNESIYVAGNTRSLQNLRMGIDEVIVQVYDPDTEIWNLLPRPSVNRTNFALVAYHEKLYVIGGSKIKFDSFQRWKEVEVFDPVRNIWYNTSDLPYAYFSPKAVVINDQLIVYDNHPENSAHPLTRNPSVTWNVKEECWEIKEGSFSNINLHMYHFFSLEEVDYVHVISKQNKDPETVFEQSPFSN